MHILNLGSCQRVPSEGWILHIVLFPPDAAADISELYYNIMLIIMDIMAVTVGQILVYPTAIACYKI